MEGGVAANELPSRRGGWVLALSRRRHRHRVPHVLARSEVVFLSLAAAFLFALGSVLQHRAAARLERHHALKPTLLLRLAARPMWLVANAVSLLAYGFQFVALRRGSLLVVQPLLVTTLLFALPMGAHLAHHALTGRDWAAAVAVVAGLAAFLAVANPDVGRGEASGLGWFAVAVLCGTPVAVLVAAAARTASRHRAAYLGAAAGIVYGVTAALTKATGTLLNRGLLRALGSWEPYALGALALVGLVLSQSAFQAGPLQSSLPLFTVGEPAVAATIGALAFHEHFVRTAPARTAEALAVVAIVSGVLHLTRSSPVLDAQPFG